MTRAVEPSVMLARLRGLLRRRGSVGALVLAASVGAATGLLATNVVLAGWTYRDAARRDLRDPGRWALAVLLTGPAAFVPYSAMQWYKDRSRGSGHTASDEPRDLEQVQIGSTDAAERPPVGRAETGRRAGSLASATVRYGGRAAALGVRGARWAGRRAVARVNDR